MKLFLLTTKAIESYKRSDPLESFRNPRPKVWQWDTGMALTEWIVALSLILAGFLIDCLLLPFRIMRKSAGKDDRNH